MAGVTPFSVKVSESAALTVVIMAVFMDDTVITFYLYLCTVWVTLILRLQMAFPLKSSGNIITADAWPLSTSASTSSNLLSAEDKLFTYFVTKMV